MATDIAVSLEEREVEPVLEKMGATEPGNARPDDGEAFHERASLGRFFHLLVSTIAGFLVDVIGDCTKISDQAEFREKLESVVGDIDLPPVEPLACRAVVAVVVVVPTFAEGDEGEDERITGIIGRLETAFAEGVRHAVDEECAVKEEDCRDEESPYENLETARSKAGREMPQECPENPEENAE